MVLVIEWIITSNEILPFGRPLKEGLSQVFAQQIASQEMESFSEDKLDNWLIALDSVMATIGGHVTNKTSRI